MQPSALASHTRRAALPEAPLCRPCRAHYTGAHSPRMRSCSWTTKVRMAARHRMAVVAWRRSATRLEQCRARCRMAAAARRFVCCRTWPRWGREVREGGGRWQRWVGGPAWETQHEKIREVFLAVGCSFDVGYTPES